jgi:poly(hydroxyalkanoate) granule-associated protein
MKKDRDMQQELRESAHKIWLAGLGALAVAGEEGKALFHTLVERGTDFEARGSKELQKVKGKVADAKSNVGMMLEQVSAGFDDQVAKALHRLGVPSRNEIATLTKRVEELTKSIEKAKKPGPRAKAAQ